MIFASNPIGDFIERHPTVKMLALAFIILVGMALVHMLAALKREMDGDGTLTRMIRGRV